MLSQRGLTLLELLVVMVILSLVTMTVVLSVRDDQGARLTDEAQQLIARLEASRALARTQHQTLDWRTTEQGYAIGAQVYRWQDSEIETRLQVGRNAQAKSIPLGPDPVLPATRLQLRLGMHELTVRTDGLNPFEVER